MADAPSHGLELRSKISADGLELSLAEVPVRAPAADEVVVRIGGAPVNPSDLNTLVGPADLARATLGGSAERPVLTAPLLPGSLDRVKARLDRSLPAGIEGGGVVVAAGDNARGLLGRTVGCMGGGMYAQYVTLKASQCLVLPEGVTPAEGAACFVNPLTALGMVETMRLEGHTGLVHTAAASSLGQMLVRICRADGVPLVNIVRKPEQAALLRGLGAEHVCDTSAADFRDRLTEALKATGATIAFDAVGGGRLQGDILAAMEAALQAGNTTYNPYGAARHKQLYIYGALDTGPTEIARTFGMAWGMGGWLLTPFLTKAGQATADRLRARVAAEVKTTFANHYAAEVSLAEFLRPEALADASRRATGRKYLINPAKG